MIPAAPIAARIMNLVPIKIQRAGRFNNSWKTTEINVQDKIEESRPSHRFLSMAYIEMYGQGENLLKQVEKRP